MKRPNNFRVSNECIRAEFDDRPELYYTMSEYLVHLEDAPFRTEGESILAFCDDHKGAEGYYISASSQTRDELELPIFEAFLRRTEKLKQSYPQEYDHQYRKLRRQCRSFGMHVLAAVTVGKKISSQPDCVLDVDVSVIMPRFLKDNALQYGERLRLSPRFAEFLYEMGGSRKRIEEAKRSETPFLHDYLIGNAAILLAGGSHQRSPYLTITTDTIVR